MINTKCYLCGSEKHKQRDGKVRDREELKIYECLECGLVFLSSFNHIDEEFYTESQMHLVDVIPSQKINKTAKDTDRRIEFLKPLIEGKKILDFGCGYGGFLLKAQEIAKETWGIELDKKAQKFCSDNNIIMTEINQEEKFDLITMFHVIEHLKDPVQILEQLKKRLHKNGKIVIETPNANDALLELYKNNGFQNFTYWGCHLFLYNLQTLCRLGEKAGFKVSVEKQIQRYPLSNHLYWLAANKPGGDSVFVQFNTPEINQHYTKILEELGMCDTILIILEDIGTDNSKGN